MGIVHEDDGRRHSEVSCADVLELVGLRRAHARHSSDKCLKWDLRVHATGPRIIVMRPVHVSHGNSGGQKRMVFPACTTPSRTSHNITSSNRIRASDDAGNRTGATWNSDSCPSDASGCGGSGSHLFSVQDPNQRNGLDLCGCCIQLCRHVLRRHESGRFGFLPAKHELGKKMDASLFRCRVLSLHPASNSHRGDDGHLHSCV
mmetsp:Transcript_26594/g.74398  ORF Transcript_26594/g.74398 Transcript_26594/m.74398 type:complete len:203 (-) Transcript_26594:1415-2023(-)